MCCAHFAFPRFEDFVLPWIYIYIYTHIYIYIYIYTYIFTHEMVISRRSKMGIRHL